MLPPFLSFLVWYKKYSSPLGHLVFNSTLVIGTLSRMIIVCLAKNHMSNEIGWTKRGLRHFQMQKNIIEVQTIRVTNQSLFFIKAIFLPRCVANLVLPVRWVTPLINAAIISSSSAMFFVSAKKYRQETYKYFQFFRCYNALGQNYLQGCPQLRLAVFF